MVPLALMLTLLQAVKPQPPVQPHEPTGCGSNIVSSTVVATFCGHREGDAEMLDLLILWRGQPGWFQRRLTGSTGSRGEHTIPFSNVANGRSSEYSTYNDVTFGYEADFDLRAATVEKTAIDLDEVNTILVDHVDAAAARRIVDRRRLSPRLPLVGDYNLFAIRRSRLLVTFLQCDIPMPLPRSSRGVPVQQPPVITVCEKLTR
jgi:hypothetical protein